MQDAPLDMRMDKTQDFSAYNVVNEYDEEQLNHILKHMVKNVGANV